MGKVEKKREKKNALKKQALRKERRKKRAARFNNKGDFENIKPLTKSELEALRKKLNEKNKITLYDDDLISVNSVLHYLQDEARAIFKKHSRKKRFDESIYSELVALLNDLENEPYFKYRIKRLKDLFLGEQILHLSGLRKNYKIKSLESLWQKITPAFALYLIKEHKSRQRRKTLKIEFF